MTEFEKFDIQLHIIRNFGHILITYKEDIEKEGRETNGKMGIIF